MRIIALSIVVGVLGSCSAGLPRAGVGVKTSFESQKDVVYSPAAWPQEMKGDLYQPEVDMPAPGVLLIHGGGWTGGDKRHQMSAIARRLAKRGFVVFNATYRTTPEWQHPAQYEDLIQALKWMKAHAEELNLDSNRLATFGYSAGGHLSALVGLQAEKEGIPIRAIVAGGAPSDLMITDSPLVEALLGGRRDEMPARFREASPINHITSKSPPVFLYHAPKDSLVWPKHAFAFDKKLTESGVKHELVWTFGWGHISGFLLPGKAMGNAVAFLDEYLRTEL
ncbi:MAG: alpha/beta hydrolase [Roseibacillus sp.]